MKYVEPVLLSLISVALGTIRVEGVTHIAFQAVAHFFLGWLIRTWAFKGGPILKPWLWPTEGFLAVGLSILEIACFFLLKHA